MVCMYVCMCICICVCVQVGQAIGNEARGLHNGDVHQGNRGYGQNGVGITMYAPSKFVIRGCLWFFLDVYGYFQGVESGLWLF